jgi:hypothetical protein
MGRLDPVPAAASVLQGFTLVFIATLDLNKALTWMRKFLMLNVTKSRNRPNEQRASSSAHRY